MNVILGISTLTSSSLIAGGILSVDSLNFHCGIFFFFGEVFILQRNTAVIKRRRDFLRV